MRPVSLEQITEFQNFELDVPGMEGIAGLFTENRIDRSTLPPGVHAYDIRGGGDDGNDFCTVEPSVRVDHTGTFLSLQQIPMTDGMAVIEDYNFDGYSTFGEWFHATAPDTQSPGRPPGDPA